MAKVLILTKYSQNGASSRYRTLQYLPYFTASGVEWTVSPLFSENYLKSKYALGRSSVVYVATAFLRRLGALTRVNRYDLVFIEYELLPFFPPWFEKTLARLKVPYVVDIDDALFHKYDQHSRKLIRSLLGNKIASVMRGAEAVVVGNDYLGDYAKRSGARRIERIPTVIDLERYPKPEQVARDQPFTIGWIGSPSTAKYVEQIAPALAAVCAEGEAQVRLIGSGAVDLPGVPHRVIPWSADTEAEELQSMDVGIMPLDDSPWERGKCGFKLIQYMACGLPVVASPVGVNRQIVEEGVNGRLADTEADWIAALNGFRTDPRLRMQAGRAGREKVEREYCLQVRGPQLAGLIAEVAGV